MCASIYEEQIRTRVSVLGCCWNTFIVYSKFNVDDTIVGTIQLSHFVQQQRKMVRVRIHRRSLAFNEMKIEKNGPHCVSISLHYGRHNEKY